MLMDKDALKGLPKEATMNDDRKTMKPPYGDNTKGEKVIPIDKAREKRETEKR